MSLFELEDHFEEVDDVSEDKRQTQREEAVVTMDNYILQAFQVAIDFAIDITPSSVDYFRRFYLLKSLGLFCVLSTGVDNPEDICEHRIFQAMGQFVFRLSHYDLTFNFEDPNKDFSIVLNTTLPPQNLGVLVRLLTEMGIQGKKELTCIS